MRKKAITLRELISELEQNPGLMGKPISSIGASSRGEFVFSFEGEAEQIRIKQYVDKTRKPEAFYTGGGIWCCGLYTSRPHIYYLLSSEDEEGFLAEFDDREDDEQSGYMGQGNPKFIEEKDFTERQRKAYNAMWAELNRVI